MNDRQTAAALAALESRAACVAAGGSPRECNRQAALAFVAAFLVRPRGVSRLSPWALLRAERDAAVDAVEALLERTT